MVLHTGPAAFESSARFHQQLDAGGAACVRGCARARRRQPWGQLHPDPRVISLPTGSVSAGMGDP